MLIIALIFNYSVANTTHDFHIVFNESDFSYTKNDRGELIIKTCHNFTYPTTNEPALPILCKSFVLSANEDFHRMNIIMSKKIIKQNIRIALSSENSPQSISEPISTKEAVYDHVQYPKTNCAYSCKSQWSDCSILHFNICPFIYDANKRELFFIESMKIEIETILSDNTQKRGISLPFTYLEYITSNSKHLNTLLNDKIESENTRLFSEDKPNIIDYVIITSKDLAASFNDLVKWKNIKGVRTKTFTTDYINNTYSGESLADKIKNCLYDLYINNNLKYALLGGDDTIVPVKSCYGKVGTYTDEKIPTDLFYACFNGNFEWNANNNDIYGEITDNIDLTPYIYVTRLPIRTSKDIINYTSKLIDYEQNPKWNNNFLMGGLKLYITNSDGNKSDSEIRGDKLFDEYIKPYWEGEKYKFYDTYTDFMGGESFDVTASNLNNIIANGYSFIDINTHGAQTRWSMEASRGYNADDADKQLNIAHSIIFTAACNTNAFDTDYPGSSDPCLSESFIRSSSNGVVGYVGSSRYGWTDSYNINSFGKSLEYEAQIYKTLFSNPEEDKHFAEVITLGKLSRLSFSQDNNANRWLQYSLNPVGDAEMPIYTCIPKSISNYNISFINNCLNLNTGLDNSKICISAPDDIDSNYYHVFNNIRLLNGIDLPPLSTICITKQNYIPKSIKIVQIQNCTVYDDKNIKANIVRIGNHAMNSMPIGDVIFKKNHTQIEANEVEILPGTSIELGASFEINTNKW